MRTQLVLGLILVFATGFARADILESFDGGAADWSIVAYPFRNYVANPQTQPAPFDAAFGNPAGSLRIGDVYGETGAAAPAPFLGDRSSCYGHPLSFDIFLRFVDAGATYPAVVLRSSTMSVYYDTPAPPTEVWVTTVVPLSEGGWKQSGTNAPVSEATFRGVLADLQGLYIYTEWHSGPDDTSLDNVRLEGTIIGVADDVPATVTLQPCYPNPFNPATTIRFAIAAAGPVRLQVLSADGRVVRTLLDEPRDAGPHAVVWDGRDDGGRSVASGTYLGRLEAGAVVRSARMTLVK
jgi:hypothetical protein